VSAALAAERAEEDEKAILNHGNSRAAAREDTPQAIRNEAGNHL
jgi:hypothetical protein